MRLIFCLIWLLILTPCGAEAATLKLELASDRVDITTGFNGTQVVVFGTIDVPDAQIVVTLKGPEKKVIVRHKGRIAGAWMNSQSVEFRRVPSYYDYAATNFDLKQLTPDVARAGQIGLENLDFYPEDDSEEDGIILASRDALIAGLQQKGFYPLKPSSIQMVQPQFFKINFTLPPGVPTGVYTVDGSLIQNGIITAREGRTLQVGQVGFNARVYNFATDRAFLYGILSILLALFSGWSAFTFLRRD